MAHRTTWATPEEIDMLKIEDEGMSRKDTTGALSVMFL